MQFHDAALVHGRTDLNTEYKARSEDVVDTGYDTALYGPGLSGLV